MKTRTDTSVYVEFSALNEWKVQLEKINDSALNTLNTFASTVENLKSSWCGNSADGFLNSTKNMIQKAKSYHTDMKNVENFLNKVIDTMDKQ